MTRAVAALALTQAALAASAATTLTFDEIPSQPVHGLSFSGVTFGFEVEGVPDLDANYGGFGPDGVAYLELQVLEGTTAGILTFIFDQPTPELSFGVAVNEHVNTPSGLLVDLYDGAGLLLDSISVDLAPLSSFAEALFSWSGPAVKRAVLDFDETAADRFAVDNLRFTTAIPEPGTFLGGLCLVGCLSGAVWLQRRRAR